MPKQHHIPAAMIAGFGKPASSGEPRDALVAVYDKESGKVFTQKAENIGWKRGTYRVLSLPVSDQDVIDTLWASYEPRLPKAIAALAGRKHSEEDLDALRLHVACALVRSPRFPDLLREWHLKHGMEVTEDQARASRLQWITLTRPMEEWYWRALHAPSDVKAPFMLPDAGFAKFPEGNGSNRELLFLPLSPQVGLIGSKTRVRGRPGLAHLDHRETTVRGTDYLNALGLLDPLSAQVFTHPDRTRRLAQLATEPLTHGEYLIPGGPYRRTSEGWL
jgi:hypothetical protein